MCKFIISTNEILDNFNRIKSFIKPKVKVCAVVKANAYGFGQDKVCSLLKSSVDFFAFARLSEALKYKQSKIDKPCFILSPLSEKELGFAIKEGIGVVVSNSHMLSLAQFYALKHSAVAKIHVKIDTGMNRFGEKNFVELENMIKSIKKMNNVELVSVFSHLFDAKNEQKTQVQLERFIHARKIVLSHGFKPIFHLASSEGLKNKSCQFDMVRVGFDLYDSKNSEHKFVCSVTEIKNVNKGENIGYSSAFKAKKNMIIAVCSAGYADGVRRCLSGYYVLINGQRARVVGNVCMDCFMADISNIPSRIGDEVVIFGKSGELVNSVCDIAKIYDTIPYEIYTSISQRVKRVYFWRNYANYSRKIQSKKTYNSSK